MRPSRSPSAVAIFTDESKREYVASLVSPSGPGAAASSMAAAKDRLRAGVAKVARVAALAKRLSTIVAPGAAGGALAALSMATGGAGSGGGGSGRLLAGIASIRNLLGPTSSGGMVAALARAATTATEAETEAADVAAGDSKGAAATAATPAGRDAAQPASGPEAESCRAGSSHAAPQNVKLDPIMRRLFGVTDLSALDSVGRWDFDIVAANTRLLQTIGYLCRRRMRRPLPLPLLLPPPLLQHLALALRARHPPRVQQRWRGYRLAPPRWAPAARGCRWCPPRRCCAWRRRARRSRPARPWPRCCRWLGRRRGRSSSSSWPPPLATRRPRLSRGAPRWRRRWRAFFPR